MKILIFLLFIGVTNGINIGCYFTSNSWGFGDLYTCQVTSLDYSGNSTHVQSYNGTHIGNNSTANVQMISFESAECPQFNLTKFPRGFSSIFPNIVGLAFRNCAFDTLAGDELQEYPNLRVFRVWIGNLVRIPGNLFSSNPNMFYIDFDSNKIEHVGEGLLDNVQSSVQVDFSRNICINYGGGARNVAERLRTQCPDDEPLSSTTTEPPTTPWTFTSPTTTGSTPFTPPPPNRCFDDFIENFICKLNDKLEGLNRKIGILESRVRILEGFESQVLQFRETSAKLERKVEMMELRSEFKKDEELINL
jgi:hypothetical protein